MSARADVRDTTCGVQSAVGRQGNAVLAEPVLEAWERVWARSETGSHREALFIEPLLYSRDCSRSWEH